MTSFFRLEQDKNRAYLHLEGSWTWQSLASLRPTLAGPLDAAGGLIVNGGGLDALDTAGAWEMLSWLKRLQTGGITLEITGFSPHHAKVLELVEGIDVQPAPRAETPKNWHQPFILIGRAAVLLSRDIHDLIAFFGQMAVSLGHTLRRPGRLRLRSTVYHIHQVGIKAIPIISLLAFLISIVLGYQGITQLAKFNAQVFTIDAVVLSVFREMGVLLTSIMVAGRSGSAFAAQIGVMKTNEEVDAMRTLGLDPFEILVLPRVIAIVLVLPVLTFIADMVGLLGAVTVGVTMLDMSVSQCLTRIEYMLKFNTFIVGIIKAPVFALLIGMVGCLRGMQVRGAAEEVGRQTTVSVVQSIFLIIMADALFSILFSMVGL